MTIPAVGPITALTWAPEFGNVQRFSPNLAMLHDSIEPKRWEIQFASATDARFCN